MDTCFFNGVLRDFGNELGVGVELWQWGRVVFIEGKQEFGLKEGKNGCRRRREQNLAKMAKTQQAAGLLFSASSRVSREGGGLPVVTRDGLRAEICRDRGPPRVAAPPGVPVATCDKAKSWRNWII